MDLFNVRVEVNNVPLKFPKRQDDWLMAVFVRAGYNKADLIRLNQVRKHQQVLFLSDVLWAQSKSLDQRYLKRQEAHESWSKL